MRGEHRLHAVLRAASLTTILIFQLELYVDSATVCPQGQMIHPCKCSERTGEIQIWCSYGDLNMITNALKQIGHLLLKEIDELILENNQLPSLPGQIFSSLKVLRLMLRENGLERVASNWLAGLENILQEVYIIEPQLRSFPDDSLITLPKLEALTLNAGAITKMPAIFGLSRLRYIQIEASSLSDIYPNNFQGLPLLEQLHITAAPNMHRLDADFIHDLPRLSILNFTQCGLSRIHPRALSRLPALTELSLSNNKFVEAQMVGIAIRDLPNVTTIRLDGNLISQLEEASFVDMPSLRNIYLNDNRITNILRAAFHRLPHLRSIDLSNNFISTIHPESFLPIKENEVEDLWLNNNRIEHTLTLRLLLDSLPHLRLLDMSTNLLEELNFVSVQGHQRLEMLNLNGNKLRRIGRDAFTGLPSLRELKLANNSLSYQLGTPYWNLPALKGLDLSRNNFDHIDRFLLSGLPSLRRYDISYNSLKSIEPSTFTVTPFLEHVNMSHNDINFLVSSTFAHLQRLYDLDVSYNNLSQIISSLPKNIEYLYLAGNHIMVLSTSSQHDLDLPLLKSLDLSDNKLHVIPASSFSSLCMLRTLHLNHNHLQMIEHSTFENLPQLRILNLANNKLIYTDKEAFKKLKHLTELNLRKNRIEIFDSSLLSQNTELKKLDLSGNRLTEIPQTAFSANKKIEELKISENFLTEFPTTVANMALLESLDISQNHLKSLSPNVLSTLSALRELNLSNNKLQSLTSGIFERLHNLSVLDLENNELEKIPPHSFRSLPSLLMARVSKNKITTIDSSAFVDLPVLQSLELQENMLTNVASDAFIACPSMLMLNLSNNLLTSMDKAGLHGVKTLEALDLSHNKITTFSNENVRDLNYLILLKIDNNRLCNIEGTPFENMSRLRMLSLRDNKMTTLSETAFSKLRSSILYFDIEGNPVKCTCSMLWLQSWLQQDANSSPGPRCSDGIHLREHRMSRTNCEEPTIDIVPGCDSKPTTTKSPLKSNALVLSSSSLPPPLTSLAQTQSTSKPNSYLKPLPEETDYFDPKFIDYHENSSRTTTDTPKSDIPLDVLSHFIAGDTPTIYAGSRKTNKTNGKLGEGAKSKPNKPAGDNGYTFFGVPIPSLNLNDFWNSGKKDERKDSRREGWSPPVHTDGFVPMLPGEGGFVPINITAERIFSTSKPNVTTYHKETHYKSGHATVSKVSSPSQDDLESDFLEEDEIPMSLPSNHRNSSYVTTSTPIKPDHATADPTEQNEHHVIRRPVSLPPSTPSSLTNFLVPGGQVTGRPQISKVQLVSGPSPHSEDAQSSHLRLAKSSLESSTMATISTSTVPSRPKNGSLPGWYFENYNRSEPFVREASASFRNCISLPLFVVVNVMRCIL